MLAIDAAALEADGYEPISWRGETVYAKPGQWVASLDGLSGSVRKQLDTVNSALRRAATAGLKAVRHLGGDGVVLLQSDEGTKHSTVKESLRAVRELKLETVEPDFALWTNATVANDTFYGGHQWGLNNVGQTGGTADKDIDAPEAWDIAKGDGSVVVGVIDSGVDFTHPDLAANMWRNPGEIAGNGRDDDGNGYTDDIHGWDFFNNDNNPMDDEGHGTHVAGTIAAAGNNATGVTGVAWNAKLMALKFLGADGSGDLSGALAAIDYATKMRTQYGVNVRVTNNSWGGGGFSSLLHSAIARSEQAGILFVAAAGNGGYDQIGDNNDAVAEYPAGYNVNNVLSVAATNHNDVLGSFSNYGATSVDLAAPGVDIASTYPGNGYVYMSGTSMATPHVSGVAALAFSYNPTATYQTVKNAILTGVDVVPALAGKVATGGRLNAYKTLLNMPAPVQTPTPVTPTVPTAPSALAASVAASGTDVNLVWADNSDNEDGFKIERSTDGTNFTQVATVAAGVRSYSDTGRSAATTYAYRVRAYNAAGDSAYTNTATATTADTVAPTTPIGLTVSGTTPSGASLSWTAATDNVAVTGYRVFRDGVQIATTSGTTFTDSGLNPATNYVYAVQAYDAAGNVSAASNSATATTQVIVPAAPSGLTATAASASQINLAWTDNSSNETGFKIERKTGAAGTWSQVATVAAGVTSWQNTGLTASTAYYYRVRAYNTAGDSAYSAEAGATTAAATPAPTVAVTYTRDVGSVAAVGSASYDGTTGVYTLRGSGADVWGTADEFRFAYTTLTGDGEIVARVQSLQASNSWAKAGVMIRETLAANSKNAFMAVTPGNGIVFQRRSSTGGSSTATGTAGLAAPYWVKLVRTGTTISGYRSLDGVTWTRAGSTTVSMTSTVYVGLALTSHADGSLATATFGNVSVNNGAVTAAATTAATPTPRPAYAPLSRSEDELRPVFSTTAIRSSDAAAIREINLDVRTQR